MEIVPPGSIFQVLQFIPERGPVLYHVDGEFLSLAVVHTIRRRSCAQLSQMLGLSYAAAQYLGSEPIAAVIVGVRSTATASAMCT